MHRLTPVKANHYIRLSHAPQGTCLHHRQGHDGADPWMPTITQTLGESDAGLLVRLRAGDRAAFAAMVQRHSGSLLRVARSLVRDQATAEELVQETWLAALTGLAGFEGRSSLRTWLFQICINKARTRFVRDGRTVPFSALGGPGDGGGSPLDPDRFDGEGAWRDPPSTWNEDNPERLAMGAQTRAAIEACIAELPETQRAVLTLRDVEGLEADEICNVLSITLTNQRVLLHRARVRVREALEARLGGVR
jgi:RNA polymerase sigma-70 factor (ECF subfamily)